MKFLTGNSKQGSDKLKILKLIIELINLQETLKGHSILRTLRN